MTQRAPDLVLPEAKHGIYVTRPFSAPTHGAAPRSYKWAKKICSCRECYELNYLEMKRTRARRDAGTSHTFVPVYRARKIIKVLRDRGMPVTEIADRIGYVHYQLQLIVTPRPSRKPIRKVRSVMVERLKNLEVETRGQQLVGSRARVDYVNADRAVRAIQGLMRQGYPMTWIEQRTRDAVAAGELQQHITHGNLSKILSGRYPVVMKSTEETLVWVARGVGLQDGGNVRVKNIAQSRGYKPLLEWDDLM